MLFIIGGVVDAVTGPVDAIKDTLGDAFGAVASFLSEVTGLDIDAEILQQVLTAISTGGLSAAASGAAEFGLDALAEEFAEVTGLPVDDVVDAYNKTI